MAKRSVATVGAYDAKTRFSELLVRVENGEEVTITKHGAPVAKLVPIRNTSTRETRRKAIDAIRDLAAGNRLRGLKIKDMIAEGRR